MSEQKAAPENEGIQIETKEGTIAATMKPSKQGVDGGETKEG